MKVRELHNAINQVAPIEGVRTYPDAATQIDFLKDATEEQRVAAQAIIDSWVDPPDPPDWDAFMDDLVVLEGVYESLASSSLLPVIMSRLARLADGAEWKGGKDALVQAWNKSGFELSPEQRLSVAGLIQAHRIPFSISDEGWLVTSD